MFQVGDLVRFRSSKTTYMIESCTETKITRVSYSTGGGRKHATGNWSSKDFYHYSPPCTKELLFKKIKFLDQKFKERESNV